MESVRQWWQRKLSGGTGGGTNSDSDEGKSAYNSDGGDPASSAEQGTQQGTSPLQMTPSKLIMLTEWDGPNDPGNPLNWSSLRKARQTFGVAFLSFAVTNGSSLITPGFAEIMAYFNVSMTASFLPFTTFVLGLAVGPIIGAPISELYGRVIIFRVSGFLYLIFILGSGFSKSFATLLICRFLAGVAGGPVLAVGSGTVADMYPREKRAVPAVFFASAPFFGPALGPVIGGFAAYYKGWRWTQWCTIFVGILGYASTLTMCETFKKTILQRRANKRGWMPMPHAAGGMMAHIKKFARQTVFKPLEMLFVEPTVFFWAIYVAFVFGILSAFFAAFPFVFITVYQFNTFENGLAFLGIGVGVLFGVTTVILVDHYVYQRIYQNALKEGKTELVPEHRLYSAMIGSVLVPISLFWFAWTSRHPVSYLAPIFAGVPFSWGTLSIFSPSVAYAIDVYGPQGGASALAANSFARYVLAACFPLFTVSMYRTLHIEWATSLLGFISIAMMPIPWVFYKFGHKIRARSKYAVNKM